MRAMMRSEVKYKPENERIRKREKVSTVAEWTTTDPKKKHIYQKMGRLKTKRKKN